MPDESADYLTALFGVASNSSRVISNEQGAVVVQVLDRRKMVTKYNVAVVKCTLNFSKKTYEDELSKFNRFLAQNKDVASIEKNAAKNGYMLIDLPGYSPMQNMIPARIGGNQSKDCARWIFDEAKEGDVSRLYECGRANDHLLLVCVKAVNDKGYLPWDNPTVKEYLTTVVKQNKKAEKALAAAKNAKTTADLQKCKGCVTDTLSNQSLAAFPMVKGVNMPEPKLAGAIAKTAVGKYSSLVQGAAAIYLVKVTGQSKNGNKFDAATEMAQYAQTIGQRAYQSVFNYMITHESGMMDHRYQF